MPAAVPCRTRREEYRESFSVLRVDRVKDDPGCYAIFTEQGSSASQMTAAKVMDIISRLPGCAGQAADAVSACTQVEMEDAPSLLKIPKSEMSRCLDLRHRNELLNQLVMVQWIYPFCGNVICVILVRHTFQSYPHRFVGIDNTSIFGLAALVFYKALLLWSEFQIFYERSSWCV